MCSTISDLSCYIILYKTWGEKERPWGKSAWPPPSWLICCFHTHSFLTFLMSRSPSHLFIEDLAPNSQCSLYSKFCHHCGWLCLTSQIPHSLAFLFPRNLSSFHLSHMLLPSYQRPCNFLLLPHLQNQCFKHSTLWPQTSLFLDCLLYSPPWQFFTILGLTN